MNWRLASRRASAVASFYAPVTPTGLHPRRYVRRPCQTIGFISYAGSELPVLMRDISAGGARIAFVSEIEVPDDLHLKVPSEKVSRRCRVVWRKARTVGLEFLPG